MNWLKLKEIQYICDWVLLVVTIIIVLSYPVEWFIRYVRLH